MLWEIAERIPQRLDRDLPDLVAFMAATGLRIGEACAVSWSDVDLDVGTVTVSGTVLRVKGQGLVISRPKSAAGERVLELPSWCVQVLRRRGCSSGPVFPAPRGRNLRDPSNTRRALREAFVGMGMAGITSHTFRKTVATLMDEAGLSARSAADQLGHAKPSITQDVYYGRKRRSPERRRSSNSWPEDVAHPLMALSSAGWPNPGMTQRRAWVNLVLRLLGTSRQRAADSNTRTRLRLVQ